MSIPDYISPIIGYRVWQWDAAGLKSVCGEPWFPGQPLAARCRAANSHDSHEPPQTDCTCGIYAAKTFHHLCSAGYDRYGVHGEVNLWGKVIEHERGWRAELAYPKNLFLPPDALPFTLAAIQARLETLIAYHADIFVADPKGNVPLWAKHSGYDAAGLDYLIGLRKRYYVRHQHEMTLKTGDRVAIIGRGIAVVEQVDDKQVHVVLWNRNVRRILRNNIVWDKQNMRWEASGSGVLNHTEGNEFSCTQIRQEDDAWTT